MPFPIDNAWINETEKELKVVFPRLFKTKMINVNGGEISTEDDDWNLYPFFDKSSNKHISRTCNHIELETKAAREWTNFPFDAIAIGNNGCGDQLILLPEHKGSSNLAETIYIWRHEEGAVTIAAATINDLIHINNDLD